MKTQISERKLREFGMLIGLGFPFLLGWLLPLIGGHQFRAWTLFIGLPGLILGFTSPRLLTYPYKGWMALGHALGWINSKIILGFVFIFVLQPISFVMRISGYDPLRSKLKAGNTYRENRQKHQIDLTRIF